MKHIALDFVHPAPWGGHLRWVLLLLGLAVGGAQLLYYGLDLAPQETALQSRLQQQGRALQRTDDSAPALKPADLSALIQQARQVDGQLNMPWNALFAFMDQASGRNLALLALEPDPAKGQLMVTAEARDFPSMLRFYSGMQASALFSDVVLQSHVINHNVPEQPIRFRLRARWNNKP